MSGSWRTAAAAMGVPPHDVELHKTRVSLAELFRIEIAAIREGCWSYSFAAQSAAHAVLDADDDVPLNYGQRTIDRWPLLMHDADEQIGMLQEGIASEAQRAAAQRERAEKVRDDGQRQEAERLASKHDAEVEKRREILSAARNTATILRIADREGHHAGAGHSPATDAERASRKFAADCLERALAKPLLTLERTLCRVVADNAEATDLELAVIVGEAVADLLGGLAQHTEEHDPEAVDLGLAGAAAKMRELVDAGIKAAHGEHDGQAALFPDVVLDPDKAWCFWWAYVPQDPRLDFPHDRQAVLGGYGPRKWLYYLCHTIWRARARDRYLNNVDRLPALPTGTIYGVVGITQRRGVDAASFVAEMRIAGRAVGVHNGGEYLGWLNVETVQRAARHRKAVCSIVVLDGLLWCVGEVQRRGFASESPASDLRVEGSWGRLLRDTGHADTPKNRIALRDGFKALASIHLRSDAGETFGLLSVKTHEKGEGSAAPGRQALLEIRLGFDLAPTPQMLAERGENFIPLVELPPLFTTNRKWSFRERLLFLDTALLLRDAWREPVTEASILRLAEEHGLPATQGEKVLEGWAGSWLESRGGVLQIADPRARKVLTAGHVRSLESSRRGRKRKGRKGD